MKLGRTWRRIGYATEPDALYATTLYVKEYLGKPFIAKIGQDRYTPADLAVPVLIVGIDFGTIDCRVAEQADINIIALLNETTAVGLYWSFINSGQSGGFIACSLGESYWEAALLIRHEKLLEVRAHATRPAAKENTSEWKNTVATLVSELLLQSHTDAADVKAIIFGGRSGPGKVEISRSLDRIAPSAVVHERLIPDAAACGAAIFAALIVRQAKDLAVWDCVATATMVGEEFSIKPLIAEQSPVPISGHFNFKATADKAQFQVMQRAGNDISTDISIDELMPGGSKLDIGRGNLTAALLDASTAMRRLSEIGSKDLSVAAQLYDVALEIQGFNVMSSENARQLLINAIEIAEEANAPAEVIEKYKQLLAHLDPKSE